MFNLKFLLLLFESFEELWRTLKNFEELLRTLKWFVQEIFFKNFFFFPIIRSFDRQNFNKLLISIYNKRKFNFLTIKFKDRWERERELFEKNVLIEKLCVFTWIHQLWETKWLFSMILNLILSILFKILTSIKSLFCYKSSKPGKFSNF